MGNISSDCCCSNTDRSEVRIVAESDNSSEKPGNTIIKNITGEELVKLLERAGNKDKEKTGATINLDLIETFLIDDDEDSRAGCEMAKRGRGKKGTGFITQQQIQKMVGTAEGKSQVKFADDKEKEDMEKSRSSERKGTGFVTKDQLLKALQEVSEDEEEDDEEDEEETSATQERSKKIVTVTENESDDVGRERKAVRKGTGYVSKQRLQKAMVKVRSDGQDSIDVQDE